MGILDDAIREHLDLKRRQGADQDELQRLEDEAFGPPTRPGDPDFERAEGEQSAAPEGESATVTEVPVFDDENGADEPVLEDELSDALSISATAGAAEDADSVVSADEPPVVAGEATVEHDTLAEEVEAEEIDLNIELQLDEEVEDAGGLDLDQGEGESPAGQVAPPPASAEDEPVESLETVEHHFDGALDEADVVEEDADALPEDLDDDEDVLEETPEFLRDAPEDDELWFEQGEPKDFDF